MTAEEGTARVLALGYHCVEAEITATWCGLSAWRKYERADALGAGAPTIEAAFDRLIARLGRS